MTEQRLNRRKLRVFAAPVLSTFLVALLALLAPQRSSGEVGAGAVAFECQHRCKGQNIASSSCPLWCRQASLRAPSSSSSSSSSSLSSSSSFPLSSSSSRVGSSRGDRQRDHSKRHAVDTEDDGGWKKRSSSVDPPPPPPIAHAAAPGPGSVLRVTADVRQTKRSTLDAVVAWSWWPTDPPGAGAGAGGRGRGPPLGPPFGEFVLHWARDTCNFDHRFPYCDDPDVYLSKTFRSQNNFTIANLTYNSKYWAEVEYEGLVSTRVTFTTPGCSKPSDHTFKRCLATSIVTVTTAGPAEDHSLRVNVTCRHLDAQMQVIRAILRWKLPAEESGNWTTWESTVLVQHTTTEGVHMEVQRTNSAEIAVTLAPERLYEIMVKASMKTKDIIYHTLYLNTSRDLSSSSSSSNSSGSSQTKATPDDCLTTTIPKPDKLKTQTTEAPLNPLVLAMAVLAVVVMTTVALVCINRCRGFQSKLLKKTLLSKSNNYKTTPGTPRLPKDEQLQMILKTDDWELDARDVTLGAEVGQGAFGLVMTGYYQNIQVAIKVLKGDVLPSYREELLREITLMKRIGKHPNIVSLIGACTVRDPIALIMEYMPFGNLQSFLQKCRLEGGLRRKETGTEVEYSPLDELNGTKEFWILSSTDMLSFARQVAVAMEFLTDRKYVHRDLAARNVLVGQNKVVKLCDFGLARLVYNGDQYCKLTNGRLPLKWMAVESIRDRVFTAQSDVWSYGVLLWEIATLGCSPYPNIALVDLFSLLTEGYRMEQPKSCSAELYDIMSQCWHESASNRPTFAGIRVQLDSMLSQRRNYLDLDCLLPSPAAAAAAARPRSPADAPYSFPASSVDLPGAEHLSRQNRRHLVETGNVAGGNVTSGGDRRWNSQQEEEEEEEEEDEEDEEEEEEESDYLQSSEIVTSVAAQKQDENRRQERGAGAGSGEEEAFANLL